MLIAALVPLTTTLLESVIIIALSFFISDLEDDGVFADSTTNEGGSVVLREASCFCSVLEGFQVVVLSILFVLSKLVKHR